MNIQTQDTINRLQTILNSKDVDPQYRERSRQQMVHLTWEGDVKECPCRECKHRRNFPAG